MKLQTKLLLLQTITNEILSFFIKNLIHRKSRSAMFTKVKTYDKNAL